MSSLEQYESRISAALERIRKGLDASPTDGTSRPDMEALKAEKAEADERIKELEANLAKAEQSGGAHLEALDGALQQLQAVNAALRESNAALRAALEDGADAGPAADASIRAELDALRASRDAEVLEIKAISAELKPLIEGSS